MFNLTDDDDDYSGLVRGTRAKFIDKIWSADGAVLPENDKYLAAGFGHVLQRWLNGKPDVIAELPLPNVDTLNEAIPKEQWPLSKFTGQPEAPWKHVRYVYLVRLSDGTMLTHINSTAGTRVAILRLKERIKTMSVLRGPVVPIVKLGWAMMPTSNFGPRPRPEFIVDDWQIFRGDQLTQIEAPKPAEELNDAIGF